MEWAELRPSYAQPFLHQDQPTPLVSLVMAPLSNESPAPLSSLPAHLSAISLATSIKEGQWTFSQYLVKVCCQNGHRLLIYTTNDSMKVQEVFGSFISPAERNNYISYFHAGMHDKTGALIDLMATVLAPLHPNRARSSLDMFTIQTGTLESAVACEAGEWLDASGVQKFLIERGYCTQEKGSPLSRSSLIPSHHVAALVQCEYLARHSLTSKD